MSRSIRETDSSSRARRTPLRQSEKSTTLRLAAPLCQPGEPIVQQLLHNCPWGHLVRILDKVRDPSEREWYVRATIEHGWSRNILVMQIESGLYQRQGAAITNFERTLPALQSDLAQQILKDPYHFDFLMLEADAQERDIERALTHHIRDFLLELGQGFAFVGSQYPIDVSGTEYRIDLLFYHIELRCFVVIELKGGDFKAEYAGKLNFYLSAVNSILRQEHDQPSIGRLGCAIVLSPALRRVPRPPSGIQSIVGCRRHVARFASSSWQRRVLLTGSSGESTGFGRTRT